MLVSTFCIQTNPDNTQFVMQSINEMDTNHGVEDTPKTNKGIMYPTGGKTIDSQNFIKEKYS